MLSLLRILPNAFPGTCPANKQTLECQELALDFWFGIRRGPVDEEGAFLSQMAYEIAVLSLGGEC
jgi:hypothetical protein